MNTHNLPENWVSQTVIRHVLQKDLRALEWGGQFTHFRRVYADAYQRSLTGLAVLWLAELQPYGIVGQVFIQLNCQRLELADGHERAYLYSFRIQPDFQSCGLGTRMVHVVEEDLQERGFKILTLNVAKDNPRAQALYERLGYIVVDQEPGVWSYTDHLGRRRRQVEPAWRMEKVLTRECGNPLT
jgi:ribosomal protein S18 acetylase RimI-like enzyme